MITSRMLTNRHMCVLINYTISESLVETQKFRNELSRIMYENTQKKRNKIKGPSITCNYIWHIDVSKSLYWLDTHSVKVWLRYVQPNANAAHFCDIFFSHKVMAYLPRKTVSKIKNPSRRRSNKIVYLIQLLVNISVLYIS